LLEFPVVGEVEFFDDFGRDFAEVGEERGFLLGFAARGLGGELLVAHFGVAHVKGIDLLAVDFDGIVECDLRRIAHADTGLEAEVFAGPGELVVAVDDADHIRDVDVVDEHAAFGVFGNR